MPKAIIWLHHRGQNGLLPPNAQLFSMAPYTDLSLLAFYQTVLVINGVVSFLQLAFWLKDGQMSVWRMAFKILLRAGLGTLFYIPMILILGRLLGAYLISRSNTRRRMILARVEADEKNKHHVGGVSNEDDADWEKVGKESKDVQEGKKKVEHFKGIIGFFHPFW